MTESEFQRLAQQGYTRIPVLAEARADLYTPLAVYLKLAGGPYSYLLESVVGGERFGRYSFIGLACAERIEARGAEIAGAGERMDRRGQEIDASWGMDVMVAPERQRQGVGEVLFRTWDRNVGASLGLGLSESSHRLFKKLRWPEAGPVPCLVKPLTRRALKRPHWPEAINGIVSAVTLPFVKVVSRTRPLRAEIEMIRRFPESFTDLWQRIAPRLDFAVRRDAHYLNWKYIEAPHVRYSIAALKREGSVDGYVVYRHLQEPRGRVTSLVDFLVDPDDEAGMKTLLRWVDREARAADSDKVRAFALHAGFRRLLRKSGYFAVKSTMEFTVKVNDIDIPADFYEHTDRWHVTLGDSDQDR